MHVTRVLCPLFVLSLAAACAGYEPLQPQPLDQDYRYLKLNWTSGKTTLIALRAFEHEGNLSVCGAYTTDIGTFERQIRRKYFDTTNLFIGEDRIGPMSFTREITVPELKMMQDAETVPSAIRALKANCVRTTRPWEARYESEELGIRGPSRIVVHD